MSISASICLVNRICMREMDCMLNRTKLPSRIGKQWVLASRLVLATALFYSVAVLYCGTTGATGRDVFVEPMIGTAIFAVVISFPIGAGWFVSRRFENVS